MARLFVAVRPPAAVLGAIASLPRPDEPGVRWVPPEQWHVTLRFLGDADPEAVATRLERVGLLPRPEVVLGPRVSRLGRSVVCLPAAGLDPLASFVETVTDGIGEPADPRPFRGHLTLARLRQRAACGIAGHRITVRFEPREVELVASTRSNRGAQHEVIERWTLLERTDPIR